VYCQDANRRGSHEHERFDFLGYRFRPRPSRSKSGGRFVNFLPAASDDAPKRMRREIRRRRLHLRPDKTLTDPARSFNPIIQGLDQLPRAPLPLGVGQGPQADQRIPRALGPDQVQQLRRYPAKPRRFLVDVSRRQPEPFAHWRFGTHPDGSTIGAR